ncbi:GNAT family N-acetyltransferase [Sporosarcina sp. BI001-red]|uniref:GNAT family N-acetyltransferase n=1 Tax=Sporosarcina sp. BI001-red TaxID=2282866 RepID=UPI000E255FCA|nr:GNAT family N-acetyltransferase [Sporosarcina sp. BI001-red]REB07312.1 GNAT family N-acetyltransferase [Sporosarcina sp. BI001-red]
MNIRRASLADAKGIAKVHVDSWKSTYKNIIPDEFLETLSYDQRTDLWIRNISKEANYIFVAENNQKEIIGFADCSKKYGSAIENSGDITSIYLLEDYQKMGVGKQLLKHLFLQFEELGVHRIFVEVLEENKTRFFYEYYGAILFQSKKTTIAGTDLTLLIYEWNDPDEVLSKL